jgi:hypothetical protein
MLADVRMLTRQDAIHHFRGVRLMHVNDARRWDKSNPEI